MFLVERCGSLDEQNGLSVSDVDKTHSQPAKTNILNVSRLPLLEQHYNVLCFLECFSVMLSDPTYPEASLCVFVNHRLTQTSLPFAE